MSCVPDALSSIRIFVALNRTAWLSMANYRIGPKVRCLQGFCYDARMRDVVILFVHLIVTAVRLARPGGLRSVVAESVLVKHQLLILNRGRKPAPTLRAAARVIAGLCILFMRP